MATAAQISPVSLEMAESGVPLTAIAEFSASSGIKLTDIYGIVIPARTLKHRRARNQSLSLDESDKFARLVRIYRFAVKVFANSDKALWWLSHPKARLNERTPLQILDTDLGGRIVEEMLGQIDEGMFA